MRGLLGLIYSNLSRQSEELDVGMHFQHQSRTSDGEVSGSVTGRSQTDLWFVLADFSNVHDPLFGIFVSYKSLLSISSMGARPIRHMNTISRIQFLIVESCVQVHNEFCEEL